MDERTGFRLTEKSAEEARKREMIQFLCRQVYKVQNHLTGDPDGRNYKSCVCGVQHVAPGEFVYPDAALEWIANAIEMLLSLERQEPDVADLHDINLDKDSYDVGGGE